MTDERAMVLQREGFAIEIANDGVARILDVELGERLGFERPTDIRYLIARYKSKIGFLHTVRRTSSDEAGRGRPSKEYWLTERQALFITARSQTDKAADVTLALVDAFLAAREQLQRTQRSQSGIIKRLVEAFLLPKPVEEWEGMFGRSLIRALCALHGERYEGGAHPRHLASTNRKIYDLIFSTEIGTELKARNPTPHFGSNHHQHLTPEAREYLAAQLQIVEAIAHQSADKDDFWRRLERHYGGGMLQLPLMPEAS